MARPWMNLFVCACAIGWIGTPPLLAQVTTATLNAGKPNSEANSNAESPVKQTSVTSKPTETTRSRHRRLPRYYGKLDLSAQQRDRVYAAQVEYGQQIDELLRQIAKLKTARDQKTRSVLTETQQQEFDAYISAALASRQAKSTTSSTTKK